MLTCIIVDDEELAQKVLESHIGSIKEITIVGIFGNALDAFTFLQLHSVDILFLDIQMPKMTGLTMLKSITNPPHIILTTAHREFALDGYDLNVLDYLVKPISLDRFVKAIGKVLLIEKIQHPIPMGLFKHPAPEAPPFIYIKSNRQFVKVLLEDILYIESIKNHVRIFTQKEIFITLITISNMEEKRPPQRFLRIHRSYVVSLSKVDKFTNASIILGKFELPIGELFKNEVLKRLNSNLI
jgi:DNA-binding LytR/AlgR family response regulator